jgi:hypothetical protein
MAPAPGSGDQTSVLQAAVDATPDGGTLCLAAGASYRMDGTLNVDERSGLTIDGQGAEVHATSLVGHVGTGPRAPWRDHVDVSRGSNITIENLGIRSAGTCSWNQDYEGEAGVHVAGTQGLTLSGLTVTGTGGDGVEIRSYKTPDVPEIPASDILLTGNTFGCIGSSGVSVTGAAERVTVQDSSYDDIGRSLIDLEMINSEQTLDGFAFTGNAVGHYGLMFLAAGGHGIQRNVTVSNNTASVVRMKVGSPNGVVDRFGFTITDNVAGSTYYGTSSPFTFLGVDGVTLEGNVQSIAAANVGSLSLTDTCHVTASGNRTIGAAEFWPPGSGCAWVDGGGNVIR